MQYESTVMGGAIAILSGLFAVLWWLLRQKDLAQQKQISMLFEKHDADAQRLQDLELDIAKHHYLKVELDPKFDRLALSFRTDMESLGLKVEKLTDAVIRRVSS